MYCTLLVNKLIKRTFQLFAIKCIYTYEVQLMFTFWTVSSDAVRTTQPTGDEYQSHGGASRRGRSTFLKTINLIMKKVLLKKTKTLIGLRVRFAFPVPRFFPQPLCGTVCRIQIWNQSAHCPKNNPNLRITMRTKPVKDGADAIIKQYVFFFARNVPLHPLSS